MKNLKLQNLSNGYKNKVHETKCFCFWYGLNFVDLNAFEIHYIMLEVYDGLQLVNEVLN